MRWLERRDFVLRSLRVWGGSWRGGGVVRVVGFEGCVWGLLGWR